MAEKEEMFHSGLAQKEDVVVIFGQDWLPQKIHFKILTTG
jgi:hypothetical protein